MLQAKIFELVEPNNQFNGNVNILTSALPVCENNECIFLITM